MAKKIEPADPFFNAYGVGTPNNFDMVPPMSSSDPSPGIHIDPTTPAEELIWLRGNFPYLPIMPVPDWAHTGVLSLNTRAYDFNIPDGTTFIQFNAYSPSLAASYISFSGSALAIANAPFVAETLNGCITVTGLGNDTPLYYCKGRRQFSVLAGSAGQIFHARGWIVRDVGK